MARLTRRELLAWMTAGTAASVAGVSWLGGGDGAGGAAPAGTRPDGSRAPGSSSGAPSTSGRSAPPSSAGSPAGASTASSAQVGGDRLLVVVEMPGGNDGLSMVVPYGEGAYYDVRPTLAVPEGDVLRIDDAFGLHPSLTRIADRGVAAVVGVGAPEPDGSHFEMMRRWWRGDPSPSIEGLGWIGRLADVLDDGSSVATAMTIGTGSHPILIADHAATLAIPGADAAWYLAGGDEGVEAAFQRGVRAIGGLSGDGYYGRLATTSASTVALAEQLVGNDTDEDDAYPDSQLGRSLLFTRRLFQLGAGVRVVHVVMEGDFDTHEDHGGRYPNNMAVLDEAVGAFWDDLDRAGLADRVLLMTTSEFGRTVHENGSSGLDHGSASSMLVMGDVAHGVVGDAPSLTELDDNDDLIATARFDSYLAAAVEGWMGVPASEVFPTAPDLLPIAFG